MLFRSPLPAARDMRCLGAHLTFHGRPVAGTAARRLDEACQLARRVGNAPLAFEARVQLLAAQAMPHALFGCAVAPLATTAVEQLRKAVMAGLWGTRRARRSAGVVLTVFAPGHQLDPASAVAFTRLNTLMHMLRRHPQLAARIRAVRAHYGAQPRVAPCGPVGLLLETVRQMDGEWPVRALELHCGGQRIPLAAPPPKRGATQRETNSQWAHGLREMLRRWRWRQVEAERTSMAGVAEGIDRAATNALWRDLTTTGYEAGTVRGVVAGATMTQVRLHEARLAGSPLCQHCDTQEEEDAEHLWWRCPAWDELRVRFRTGCLEGDQPLPATSTQAKSGQPMGQYLAGAPACLRQCGIMPEKLRLQGREVPPARCTRLARAVQANGADSGGSACGGG